MPRIAVLLLSLLLGAGCAVLVSCGSGDSGPGIPATNAEQIIAELERARASEQAGDCGAVEESATKIQANINAIDEEIDPEVKTAVDQGAQHLAELASDPTQCEEATSTTSTTDKTTSTEPEPTTTATPTTTEETTTTTTTQEQPPGNGPTDNGPPGQEPVEPAPGGGGTGGTGGVGDGQ
jgi:hypothetical protein